MTVDRALLAPCGLYCGACGIRIADAENDAALKEKLARAYGLEPRQIACEGCLSDKRFEFCAACAIRSCAQGKGLEGCFQCAEFPCERINAFPFAEARERMLRAVPLWKELGTERWVAQEEKRHRCPSCGAKSFRGARRCRVCKEPLESA
jgi:hypothetical protein